MTSYFAPPVKVTDPKVCSSDWPAILVRRRFHAVGFSSMDIVTEAGAVVKLSARSRSEPLVAVAARCRKLPVVVTTIGTPVRLVR